MFERALRVESVELKEELLWEYPRGFLENLWVEVKHELRKIGEVKWDFYKFLDRVNQEVESRQWDLRKFRNGKNEPITNLFKRIIREIAKESGLPLSNDSLSKLLNYVRNQYSTSGTLTGAVYPVRAFFERSEFGIPEDLGDDRSCFRVGNCNYGSSLWLMIEEEKYGRANFVVFHYKAGNSEGWGRCWVYKVSNEAIFATNFYSKYFEVKAPWLKYSLVRLFRLLFNLSENVKFTFNKNIALPIYLNGDGLVIYEKEKFNSSDEVVEFSYRISSQCMNCHEETRLLDLRILDEEIEFEGESVSGLIVCRECYRFLKNSEYCEGCGERFYRDDLMYHGERYWCQSCFDERFEQCYECEEYYWREDMIVDRDGYWLCQDCAEEHRRYCGHCGEWVYPDEVTDYDVLTPGGIDIMYICDDCESELAESQCEACGRTFHYRLIDYGLNEKVREIVRLGLCYECYKKKLENLVNEIFKNDRQPSLPFDFVDFILIDPR
jgi:hypothetical protein